jgi:FtsP/CotA-like multicopper oxidase with cupredoxin domain
MLELSRRTFLAAGTAAATLPLASPLVRSAFAGADPPVFLEATTRTIEVNGKAATVHGILQRDGTHGLYTEAGTRFRVQLSNRLAEQTLIHWHGLTPPYQQDGVPDLSQPALAPGTAYDYDFPLARPGSYWMHSHVGLQEQRLLAAPLIVRDPAEKGLDEQEVVILLHDFTFRDPEEILEGLRQGAGHAMEMGSESPAMSMGTEHSAMGHGGMAMGGQSPAAMDVDINDIDFDAYLANDRTLADPEVVPVETGGRVRLRIINGAAATNFVIDLGALQGELIAVDGHPVVPLLGNHFEIAISQRLDIRLQLPAGQGAYPILALREGEEQRTGIILATKGAQVHRVADGADGDAPPLGLELERRLQAFPPLAPRSADLRMALDLTGSMAGYVWTLNGARYGEHRPLAFRAGERVELTLRNRTEMSHPMHMHGHVFQVVGINGERVAGALRDTVLVPPDASVTLAFDADNPGRWAFHCHHLYHMAAGMMTSMEYLA